jgi:1,2-diacylglycerol-3-alpha-glucose alpha-1,2-galactosyltransferase
MPILIFPILQQKLYYSFKKETLVKVNVISESAFTVQGHGVHSAFTDTIDALRNYTDCEVVVNAHGSADIVHIHTVGPYSLAKLLWSSGSKVVSAHVMPDSFEGSLIGAKYWRGLAQRYLRWFYNRADAVLAVSTEVVEELSLIRVYKPVYLVPNTIKTQQFSNNPHLKNAARGEFGIAPGQFVVVGSGQVQPRKRIDIFVKMAEELPDVMFVWVGGIPFKKFAASSVSMGNVMQNHPKNVVFTGLVMRDEVIDYFHASDLFFFPSMQETFGIVIVEAAAAGLPILLRDLDVYKETFGDGYEKGTDETFGEIINKFHSDSEFYKRWQSAAYAIAEKYDAKVGSVRLMHVYEDVLRIKSDKKG